MREVQYVNSTEIATNSQFDHNNFSKQSFIKITVS